MKSDCLAPLHDILHATRAIKTFTAGLKFDDYHSSELLRSAVERKFEIVGEALNRIKREDPALLLQIRNFREMISFRNILVHGYDTIDDRIVWGVIEEDLNALIQDVAVLLESEA